MLSLIVIAAAWLCGPVLRAQSAVATGTRVIAGIVISEASGQPLKDANVTLRDTKDFRLIAEGTTDSEGRFSFPGLHDGKFALNAARRGYAPTGYEEHDGAFTGIVTGENLTTTGLTLGLSPLGAIYGRVAEDSGDPVPQALLSLFRQVRRDGLEKVVRAGMKPADEMGSFEFSSLDPGTYFLCASGAPWYRQRRPIATSATGAAGGGSRSPLDVTYELMCYAETTDPAGAEPIPVKAGDRIQANITLHPVPALHILLQEPVNDPTHGFAMPQLRQEVFGFSEPIQFGEFASTQLNESAPGQATIEISGIAPGEYNLELQGPNPAQDSPKVEGIQISSSDLNIDASSLQPMASVSGKLVVQGAGIPSDCRISLISEQNEAPNSASVATDGSFRIPAVRAGTYEVRVVANNMVWAVTEARTKATKINGPTLKVGSDPIEMTVIAQEPAGAVNGFVTRHGKAAGGVFVLLVPANPNASRFAWMPNQSDSDGSFTFRRVLPGQYTVVAIDQGWTLDWRQRGVIDPYLANGAKLTVEPTSKEVNLKVPLESQNIDSTRAQ